MKIENPLMLHTVPPTWALNAWYPVCWSDEIEKEKILARTTIGVPMALYRTAAGEIVAFEDRCCHRFAPLSMGRLEGDSLRCMYHGFRFTSDGVCDHVPGQDSVPRGACVKKFAAVDLDGWIWIWGGDAVDADTGLIPRSPSWADETYRMVKGTISYEADYRLLNDNLLDLSHLAFLHEKTLGLNSPEWGVFRPSVMRHANGRGLRVQRWLPNKLATHYLAPDAQGQRFDVWNSYDYTVPGIFSQSTNWYPLGTAAALNGAAPESAPFFMRLDKQSVTPVEIGSLRYMFATGGLSSLLSAAKAQEMLDLTALAFEEDRQMIEAQQRVINSDPSRTMVLAGTDTAPVQFRRILQELIKAQRAEPAPI